MYEAFFGLREKPFALAPDPEFLFLGRHHRRALTLLDYTLRSGLGFALVTGRVGCGKTTVVRSVLARAPGVHRRPHRQHARRIRCVVAVGARAIGGCRCPHRERTVRSLHNS